MSSTAEPRRHAGSYVDPAGGLYERDGAILRGILPEYSDFYRSLLSKPPVREMIGQTIVDTTVEPRPLEGYGLTLQHRRISPVTFCYEWPPQMLRAAALLTLDICIELADHGLVLKDAYPWNVVFEGTRPIFVDFTSIVPEDPMLWVAYDQFCRFFLFPLAIAGSVPHKVVRALLLDHINGMSVDDLRAFLPFGASLAMPWLISRVYLPQLVLRMVRGLGREKTLTAMSARLSPSPQARRAFFTSLRKNVRGISLPIHRSRWARYYADIESFMRPADFDPKQATVARILDQCRPKTVVDIGCNRGGYSILAAQAGARVTAFDTDEDSVALLYQLARDKQLDILPLEIDFLSPSPACGWRGIQYPAAPQRLQAEMAFALALVHHLAITQRQTWDRIVPALADYAARWLITEFVPLDDPRSVEIMATHQRDMSWYTLEGFITALQTVFSRVETFPSYPEGRTLLLCTR